MKLKKLFNLYVYYKKLINSFIINNIYNKTWTILY